MDVDPETRRSSADGPVGRALGVAGRYREDAPNGHPDRLPSGLTVQAHVTCAFLTGRTVDRPRLVAEGYREARQRVLERLGADPDAAAGDPQGVLFSADSESGAEIGALPFVSVSEDWLRADICAALPDPGQAPFTLEVAEVRADLYDFGVGTLNVTYELTADRDVDAEQFCRWSAGFRAEIERENEKAVQTVATRFRLAIDQDITHALFEAPARRGTSSSRESEAAWRSYADQLLWLHTIYACQTPQGDGPRALFGTLAAAIPSHQGAVELTHAIVCPGNLVSVVVGDHHAAWKDEATAFANVIVSMNAWWTAIWELDRLLFTFLNEFNVTGRRVVAERLEQQSRRIESLDEHVRLFRTLLETDLLNRSGRERRLWDVTAPVWWFGQNLAAVETKIQALRELKATLGRELTTRRTNRLDVMVACFTVFAVLGGFAEAAGFVAPNASSGTRLLLTACVIGLAVLALVAAFWNRPFTRYRSVRLAEHDVAEFAPTPASGTGPGASGGG